MTSGKSLSLEMLRAGWATTYEQSNAEYGPWGKEEFLRVEQEAKCALLLPHPFSLVS
jgi:endonuclease YncB( thermonuclease family)